MSAILGLVRTDGAPVTSQDLEAPMKVVAHYGRDGGGRWSDERSVALGCCHRALWKQAGGKAPRTLAGCTIVADVRIDNRDEVCARLGMPPEERRGIPDDELVLRAYLRWGEECPVRLIGDYAFAIWDETTRRLFCARDHIGSRPFYYYQANGVFAFATDIRAVLAMPGVVPRLDEVEVAQMLVSGMPVYFDSERTFFCDLRKLPFGHRLSWAGESCRVTRYWKPEEVAPLVLATPEDYVEQLRELLHRAVDDRIDGVDRIGAHVSGGLDSSALAVLAARQRRRRGEEPPVGFSWSPPPESDGTEYPYIESVSRQEGIVMHYAGGRSLDVATLWDTDIATKPTVGMLVEQEVQRLAECDGVRLVLSGWGGDQGVSFTGAGLLAQLVAGGRWAEIGQVLRPGVRAGLARDAWRAAREVWRSGFLPWVGVRSGGRGFDRNRTGPGEVRPDFLRLVGVRLRDEKRSRLPQTDPRRAQWDYYYSGQCTARIEAWAVFGAERGLTYGYPLLDRRIMEFAYAVPPGLFWREGQRRWLFRRAVEPLLPAGMAAERSKRETAFARRGREMLAAAATSIRLRLVEDSFWRSNPWVEIDGLAAVQADFGDGDRVMAAKIRVAWSALQIWRHWGQGWAGHNGQRSQSAPP